MSNLREERLEYMLKSLANKIEWCVNPELLSRATVDRARENESINEAKQAILAWHNKQIEEVLDRVADAWAYSERLKHDNVTVGEEVFIDAIEAERVRLRGGDGK